MQKEEKAKPHILLCLDPSATRRLTAPALLSGGQGKKIQIQEKPKSTG
jgi:hypothetical protein